MAEKPEKEEAAPKQPEKGADAGAAGQGKSSKMMLWGIVGAIIVLEIPLMYYMINVTRPKSPEEIAAEKKADSLKTAAPEHAVEVGHNTKKEPIEAIVNIAGTDGDRFLKAVVVFEYHDPDVKEEAGGEGEPEKTPFQTELEKRMPRFKSMLIDLLSKKTLVELNEPNARDQIAKEYLHHVNSIMPPGEAKITAVLFDQFIIQ